MSPGAYILIGGQAMGESKVMGSSRMRQPPGRVSSTLGVPLVVGVRGGSQDWKPTSYNLSKHILLCVWCAMGCVQDWARRLSAGYVFGNGCL